LLDQSDAIEEGIPLDLEDGTISVLVERIGKQKQWHRSISESLYPGGFDKSYLVEEYDNAQWIASSIAWQPKTLPDKIDALILAMHRIMILSNVSEDQLKIADDKLKKRDEELAIQHKIEIEKIKPLADKWSNSQDAKKKLYQTGMTNSRNESLSRRLKITLTMVEKR